MKNLLLIFMMLFAVDSIAQLDQREKGDVVSPALNKNPNFIQKTGWTFEAIDPINDTLCSITPSPDNLTILTTNVCNARVYQDINSADIRKARFDKETMTTLLKIQALTYVKITLNVYKKAATSGTLTLLRTRSLEHNSNVPLRDKKIVFDVVTEDLNFVTNANLADSLRIEFTFEPTVVFPSGVAKVEINDFRVFSALTNYSPLLHEVKEESGWTEWQPTTITASTTNPTKGTPTTDACRKRRDGTQLNIEFIYAQASGGSSGSGNYIFSCGGFELNGESLTPDYTSIAGSASIGVGKSHLAVVEAVLTADNNIFLQDNTSNYGSTHGGLPGSVYYRFNASIAIKEWKQSTTSLLTKADTGRVSEIIFTSQEYAPNNFISAANKSIGNTGSTADYTGSNYRELYNILWSQMGTGTTAGHPYRISSARGASADADWAANKTITIDYVTNEVFIRAKGSARDLGSYQADELKSHRHTVRKGTGGTLVAFDNAGAQGFAAFNAVTGGYGVFGSGAEPLEASGGTETRPKNVALNAYIRYRDTVITASLLESNIIKDVEQFHTDERKICDRCWKGKALYKKCYELTSDQATPYALSSFVAGYSSIVGWVKMVNEWHLPLSIFRGVRVYINTSGTLTIQSDVANTIQAGTNFCVEYSKD